VAHFKGKQTPN